MKQKNLSITQVKNSMKHTHENLLKAVTIDFLLLFSTLLVTGWCKDMKTIRKDSQKR